jgi:hypothetical protein
LTDTLNFDDQDPNRRKAYWRALYKSNARLNTAERQEHYQYLILAETDADCRSLGLACLSGLSEPTDSVPLRDWIWKPFKSAPLSRIQKTGRSAVVAICDREHIKDVDPLVRLARFLPDSCADTRFHVVPFKNVEWGFTTGLRAICFVGRPSMFANCHLFAKLPTDRRFDMPGDDDIWRGRPLNNRSAKAFHHIRQNRRSAPAITYLAHHDKNEGSRVDYAMVQRFRLDFKDHYVTVLILAGATSLATVGAAQWVTSDLEIPLPEGTNDATAMEALLEVRDTVRDPPRPWEPKADLKTLFLNGVNVVRSAPSEITLGCGSNRNDVRYILLDEDEVEVGGDAFAALAALCLAALGDRDERAAEGAPPIDLGKLMNDKSSWPNHKHAGDRKIQTKPAQFFRDNIQKGRVRLGEAVTITKNDILHFHCRLRLVRATAR